MPTATQPPTGRRLVVAEAGVRVIAARGLRGLTHRAVDAEAGLPVGSSSVLARTRLALLTLVSEHVAARMLADIDPVTTRLVRHLGECGEDPAFVRSEVVDLLGRWLEDADFLLARSELALEAMRQPELGALFEGWRGTLLEVIQHCIPARLPDSDRRALTMLAALEGVLITALGRPEAERRGVVDQTVGLLTEALAQHASVIGH